MSRRRAHMRVFLRRPYNRTVEQVNRKPILRFGVLDVPLVRAIIRRLRRLIAIGPKTNAVLLLKSPHRYAKHWSAAFHARRDGRDMTLHNIETVPDTSGQVRPAIQRRLPHTERKGYRGPADRLEPWGLRDHRE